MWQHASIYGVHVIPVSGLRGARHHQRHDRGCTGGQHRSVYVCERLAEHFRPDYQVLVRHRQLNLGA